MHNPTTRLNELSIGELFVVSSVRLWLLTHCGSINYPDWRQGFRHAGIASDGALGLDTLCRILTESSLEPLVVHRLHCPVLAAHEMWTLQVLGLLQREQIWGAEEIFAQRCAPGAARLALSPALTLARALSARQLWLSCHEGARTTTCANRGAESSRIH